MKDDPHLINDLLDFIDVLCLEAIIIIVYCIHNNFALHSYKTSINNNNSKRVGSVWETYIHILRESIHYVGLTYYYGKVVIRS